MDGNTSRGMYVDITHVMNGETTNVSTSTTSGTIHNPSITLTTTLTNTTTPTTTPTNTTTRHAHHRHVREGCIQRVCLHERNASCGDYRRVVGRRGGWMDRVCMGMMIMMMIIIMLLLLLWRMMMLFRLTVVRV